MSGFKTAGKESFTIPKGKFEALVKVKFPPRPPEYHSLVDLIQKEAKGETIEHIRIDQIHLPFDWPFGTGSVSWDEALPYILHLRVKNNSFDYPPVEIVAWTKNLVIYHHRDNEYPPCLDSLPRNP